MVYFRHWTKLGFIDPAQSTVNVIQKIVALKEKRLTLGEIKDRLQSPRDLL